MRFDRLFCCVVSLVKVEEKERLCSLVIDRAGGRRGVSFDRIELSVRLNCSGIRVRREQRLRSLFLSVLT